MSTFTEDSSSEEIISVEYDMDTDQQQVESRLWLSSKNPTKEDKLATSILLQLREQLRNKFDDKRTIKKHLWIYIATQLNDMGLFVGDPNSTGWMKVRQKFTNLQYAYTKCVDNRSKTGEGYIADPPFFKEMQDILGDKHKVTPVKVIDSLEPLQSDKKIPEASTSKNIMENTNTGLDSPSTSMTPQSKEEPIKRFCHINKSVKPANKKMELLERLVNVTEQSLKNQNNEFETLLNFLNKESKQRHAEIMALIGSRQPKKRKQQTPSDSD